MSYIVQFVDIKILSYSQVLEDTFTHMKSLPCIVKHFQCLVCVCFEMGVVDEVESGMDSFCDTRLRWLLGTVDYPQKCPLHGFVFHHHPLRCEGDALLEVPEVRMSGQSSITSVDFISVAHDLLCPFRYMITEDTLVKLMEHVGCYAIIDVTVRKILPERSKGSKVLCLKLEGFEPSHLLVEDIKGLGGRLGFGECRVSSILWGDKAKRTGILMNTGNETLFRVVSYVG
jgi:hypothetical protein